MMKEQTRFLSPRLDLHVDETNQSDYKRKYSLYVYDE